MNDKEPREPSQHDRNEYWSYKTYHDQNLENELYNASSRAEKIFRLKQARDGWAFMFPDPTIYGDGSNYVEWLDRRIEEHEEILKMENQFGNSFSALSDEQIQANKRVVEIFEKQTFWSGSLSDFVYTFDTLALKGYLKANELEEALSENFAHKGKGKKSIERTTPNKIKTRRRNMKQGTHTPSSEIRATIDEIIEKMPGKKKP